MNKTTRFLTTAASKLALAATVAAPLLFAADANAQTASGSRGPAEPESGMGVDGPADTGGQTAAQSVSVDATGAPGPAAPSTTDAPSLGNGTPNCGGCADPAEPSSSDGPNSPEGGEKPYKFEIEGCKGFVAKLDGNRAIFRATFWDQPSGLYSINNGHNVSSNYSTGTLSGPTSLWACVKRVGMTINGSEKTLQKLSNAPKREITKNNAKKPKLGSTSGKGTSRSTPKWNATVTTKLGSCTGVSAIRNALANETKNTNVVFNPTLHVGADYPKLFDATEIAAQNSCTDFGLINIKGKSENFPIAEGVTPLVVSFAKGKELPAEVQAPVEAKPDATPVPVTKPAPEVVVQPKPANDTAELSCKTMSYAKNMDVAYVKDGVSATFTINAGNFFGLECNNGQKYAAIINTNDQSELLKMANDKFVNLGVLTSYSEVEVPACTPSIEKICTSAGFTLSPKP